MAFIDNLFLLLFLLISVSVCVDSRVDNSTESLSTEWKTTEEYHKHIEDIDVHHFCNINENCTRNMLCVDNRCQCRPNHKWNLVRKECHSFDCKSNETECRVADPHRECRHISLSISSLFRGECECIRGFLEDRRNLKCRQWCSHNRDCDLNLGNSHLSNNMVCVDFLCQCRPNFNWNAMTKTCETFNCTKDAECWTGADENRECIDGQCQCNFQEDLESTKCYLTLYSVFRIRNYKTRKERLLLCTLVIMPSVVLYCLYSQWKKKKSQKLIAKSLESKPANINYVYMTRTEEMKTTKI